MAQREADVSLEVDGYELRGWKSVSILRAIDRLAGAFTLKASELEPDDPLARDLQLGQQCTLRVDDEVVLTGYVEDLVIDYGGARHSVSAAGRDLTGDLFDCSADRDPGEWNGQRIGQIVRDLISGFDGISLVEAPIDDPEFQQFRIHPGETVYAAISRAARMRGLVPNSDGKGGLRLWVPGTDLAEATIDRSFTEAGRIKRGAVRRSTKERFSRYRVKGQSARPESHATTGEPAPQGIAIDPGIGRHRPLLMVETNPGDAGSYRRRAQIEATTRAARSEPVSYTLQGWRSATGWLWSPGYRVPVFDPLLGIATEDGGARELLIASVTQVLSDDQGEIVELQLLDPVAFRVLDLEIL